MSDTNNRPTDPNVVQLHAKEQQQQPPLTQSLLEQILENTVRRVTARPSPFDLNSFEDIDRFAELINRSDLCPKDYKGKPANIVHAIMQGKELGLKPMASLASIAVVNGRASLWGEAVPGLCFASGQVQDVQESFEGDPGSEDYTAICVVTRKGFSPMRGFFSIRDTKTAGLGNVHKQYPRDMLMWRARHRAWHAAFPDILRGMATAEIEQDIAAQSAWTMPRPTQEWQTPAEASDWLKPIAQSLMDENRPWPWLEILVAALKAAPTLQDVDDLEGLKCVVDAKAKAPEEPKVVIDEAFVAARARLTGPPVKPAEAAQAPASKPAAQSTPAAEPAQQAPEAAGVGEPEFEYALLDIFGEPVDGEIHTDPLAWARAFAQHADPHAQGYRDLCEQNADAQADARKHPAAGKILDALDAEANPPARSGAAPVIEPTITRGKPDWTQYHKDLAAALAGESAATLVEFAEAQRERVSKFPDSHRMHAAKAVADRAKELGIPAPKHYAKAPKEEPQPEEKPPEAEAAKPATDPLATATPDDRAKILEILAHIRSLKTKREVNAYSNGVLVENVVRRLSRDGRGDLVEYIRAQTYAHTRPMKEDAA